MTRFNASALAFVAVSLLGAYALCSLTGLRDRAAWKALWRELKSWLKDDTRDEWTIAAERYRVEAKQYGTQVPRHPARERR